MLPFCSCQSSRANALATYGWRRNIRIALEAFMFDCHQLDGGCIAAHAHRSNPKLAGPCISETPSGTDVSTFVEQVNYDHLAKVLTRTTWSPSG